MSPLLFEVIQELPEFLFVCEFDILFSCGDLLGNWQDDGLEFGFLDVDLEADVLLDEGELFGEFSYDEEEFL